MSLGDIEAAVAVIRKDGHSLESAVFPKDVISDFIILANSLRTDERGGTSSIWDMSVVAKVSPLFYALISAGADVNAVGTGGGPPLFDAVSTNWLKLVKLLLANGADVNFREEKFGRSRTAMNWLHRFYGDEMRQLLYEAGSQD